MIRKTNIGVFILANLLFVVFHTIAYEASLIYAIVAILVYILFFTMGIAVVKAIQIRRMMKYVDNVVTDSAKHQGPSTMHQCAAMIEYIEEKGGK